MYQLPNPYAATYIVQAPAPATLASVRAELLPLAAIVGYTDVLVGCSTNMYGSTYTATAFGPGGSVLCLANIFDNPTAEAMREAAFRTLYTAAGASGASL